MKRMRWLIVLLVLIIGTGTSVWAAGIPSKQGLVRDTAGLFDSSQRQYLSKIAKGEQIRVFVLTVPSLEGQSPTDYANAAYDAWNLGTADVLLLISSGDRSVEFNFNNPRLQQAIDEWSSNKGKGTGSSAITAMLDAYFIPHAKEGSFSKASASMIHQVHRLAALPAGEDPVQGDDHKAEAVSPAPENKGSVKSTDETTRSTSTADTAAPLKLEFPKLPWIEMVAGGLGITLIFMLIWGYLKKRKLSMISEQFAELLVKCNASLEKVGAYQGIAQGKTGRAVQEIADRLSEFMVAAAESKTELQETRIFILRYSSMDEAIQRFSKIADRLEHGIKAEDNRITVIEHADKTAKGRTTELHADYTVLKQTLDRTAADTGYPFPILYQELEGLEQDIQRAVELQLFDPLEAQEVLKAAEQKHSMSKSNIEDVAVYVKEAHEFSDQSAAIRAEIVKIIETHQLYRIKVRPFERLDDAREQMNQLENYLRQGNMGGVRKSSERAHAMLKEALGMTRRQAELRRQNRNDLDRLYGQIQQFHNESSVLQSMLNHCRSQYVPRHWQSWEQALAKESQEVRMADGKLPEAERLTHDEVQEFEEASEIIENESMTMARVLQWVREMKETLEGLDDRLQAVRRELAAAQEVFVSQQKTLQIHNVVTSNNSLLLGLPDSFWRNVQTVGGSLSSPLYDLDYLESAARSCTQDAENFAYGVQDIVRQKEEAERLSVQVEQRFKQVSRRASRGFKKNYKSYRLRVEQLFGQGMYAEASHELLNIAEYIDRVEREIRHQEMLEQQRRAAQQLQRAADQARRAAADARKAAAQNSSRPSGSSWGSSSGSSHSSGGSGWGDSSSGNSSGGSSWDNNNSSGGSKW